MGADERIDLLFLQYLTFFPIDILRRMTEAAGGKAALRSLPGNALFSLGITPGLIQIEQYETARQPDFLNREEEQLMKKGIRFVSEDDPDFPARLKNIPDAPLRRSASAFFRSSKNSLRSFGWKKSCMP